MPVPAPEGSDPVQIPVHARNRSAETGRITLAGAASELERAARVRAAYLGG
jgi:hypothetical protein